MAELTPMERFTIAQEVAGQFRYDFFYAQDCWEMGFICPCENEPTEAQEESGEYCEGYWFIDLHAPIPFDSTDEAPGEWSKWSYFPECTCGEYVWDDELDDEENERREEEWQDSHDTFTCPARERLQKKVDRALERAWAQAEALKDAAASTGPLAGETLVFTGALCLPRADAAIKAVAAGGTVSDSVGKKTTVLVVGDEDLKKLAGHDRSSKHRKAEELLAAGQAIRIIGETEFLALVEG